MDTDCVLLHLRRSKTSEVGHGLRHQLFDSTRSRGSPKKNVRQNIYVPKTIIGFFSCCTCCELPLGDINE